MSHRFAAVLASTTWWIACGGSVSPGGSVSGNDAAGATESGGVPVGSDVARARVYINATVGPGTSVGNGATACMYGNPQMFVYIGTPTAPRPATVADGDTQQLIGAPGAPASPCPTGCGAVHVTCSVVPAGNAFHVQASATVEGTNGGTVSIAGDVDASGGTGLSSNFNNALPFNGTFSATASGGGCTVSYTADPPPIMPAVAAGRIWGHISCPFATSDRLVDNPDGSATRIPRTCDAEADFLFENCG
jgi:hypothetical protein